MGWRRVSQNAGVLFVPVFDVMTNFVLEYSIVNFSFQVESFHLLLFDAL